MIWKIEFINSAEKEFAKLERDIQKRIVKYLKEKVSISPRDYGIAMQGDSKIKLWRYRIGDYRLICQIKDNEVTILVVKIGKRDSVYNH